MLAEDVQFLAAALAAATEKLREKDEVIVALQHDKRLLEHSRQKLGVLLRASTRARRKSREALAAATAENKELRVLLNEVGLDRAGIAGQLSAAEELLASRVPQPDQKEKAGNDG